VFPGQPPVLMRLTQSDGLSQKELARRVQVRPATMTVMINRMEKSGLVKRMQDERDQRVSRVFLTEKGRLATQAVKKALYELETVCFEHFDEEEKILLARMLEKMHVAMAEFHLKHGDGEPIPFYNKKRVDQDSDRKV
jgi:DNA-binding MarR family transcriptional regulator